MTEKQKMALEELVYTVERFKAARVIVDYATALACVDADDFSLQEEMDEHLEKLYRDIYFEMSDGEFNCPVKFTPYGRDKPYLGPQEWD